MFARIFGRKRPTGPTWTEPDELRRQWQGGAAPTIVDVREPDEFDGPLGHIPGALNIPLGRLAERTDELARSGRPIVLVCLTDKRSARAAAELARAGVSQVSVLRGGMTSWRG